MSPTLTDGQLVLTRSLGRRGGVRRGDLVVAEHPEVAGPLVKRVIGLPGERISIAAGAVAVNGSPLREAYASPSVYRGEFHVPDGHYLLLGDNRDRSTDSRSWRQPFVPRSALRGRLLGTRDAHNLP